MRCPECRYNYPVELLQAMFVQGRYTQPICGICALEISNRVMGERRRTFTGPQAEAARREAVRLRRTQPRPGSVMA